MMFKFLMIALCLSPTINYPDKDKKPTLDQLSWMVGNWTANAFGGECEEYWTPAKAGTMLGSFRLAIEDELKVIEYILITQEKERVVMRFKHFRSDYSTWEKDKPLEFTLIEISDREAVFHSEVPGQNSPRRLTYRLEGDRGLLAIVSGSNEEGKLAESFEIHFTRK